MMWHGWKWAWPRDDRSIHCERAHSSVVVIFLFLISYQRLGYSLWQLPLASSRFCFLLMPSVGFALFLAFSFSPPGRNSDPGSLN